MQETGSQTPRVLTFTRHDLPIDLPTVDQFRARGDAEREYILPELLRIGWNSSLPEGQRDAVASYTTEDVIGEAEKLYAFVQKK